MDNFKAIAKKILTSHNVEFAKEAPYDSDLWSNQEFYSITPFFYGQHKAYYLDTFFGSERSAILLGTRWELMNLAKDLTDAEFVTFLVHNRVLPIFLRAEEVSENDVVGFFEDLLSNSNVTLDQLKAILKEISGKIMFIFLDYKKFEYVSQIIQRIETKLPFSWEEAFNLIRYISLVDSKKNISVRELPHLLYLKLPASYLKRLKWYESREKFLSNEIEFLHVTMPSFRSLVLFAGQKLTNMVINKFITTLLISKADDWKMDQMCIVEGKYLTNNIDEFTNHLYPFAVSGWKEKYTDIFLFIMNLNESTTNNVNIIEKYQFAAQNIKYVFATYVTDFTNFKDQQKILRALQWNNEPESSQSISFLVDEKIEVKEEEVLQKLPKFEYLDDRIYPKIDLIEPVNPLILEETSKMNNLLVNLIDLTNLGAKKEISRKEQMSDIEAPVYRKRTLKKTIRRIKMTNNLAYLLLIITTFLNLLSVFLYGKSVYLGQVKKREQMLYFVIISMIISLFMNVLLIIFSKKTVILMINLGINLVFFAYFLSIFTNVFRFINVLKKDKIIINVVIGYILTVLFILVPINVQFFFFVFNR